MPEEREPLPIKLGQAVHRIVMRGTATGEFVSIEPSVAAQFISSGLMFVLFPFPRSARDERALPFELTSLAFRTLSIAAPSAPTTLAR
jgi:hypothetical protein